MLYWHKNKYVNGIVFLLSFLDCPLLVYRKTTDFLCWFFILQHCWIHLLSKSFSCGFLRVSTRSYLNIEIALHLHFQCGYFLFFLPIALARTSSTMLSRSGESKHSYLIPDLGRKAFSLSPPSILVLGFSYMAFTMLRKFPSLSNSLGVLILKRYWILSNVFPTSCIDNVIM